MNDEVILGNVMVDCDDEIKLQRFYGELLGWEMCELFDRPAVRSSNGIVFLFIEKPDYVAPVWPEGTGKQQKQMHFDFQVNDVNVAIEKAISLGATKHQISMEENILLQCLILQVIRFVYVKSKILKNLIIQ